MRPSLRPDRTARAAAQVLDHPIAQQFPYRAVELLRAIERGDADVEPAGGDRLLQLAMQACITSEIVASREARPSASGAEM